MKSTNVARVFALAATVSQAFGALDASRYLWYDQPGTPPQWEQSSLPIGNGRLAATIYGSVNEVVTLNENSIWSGPIQDRTPADALSALPVAREMLLAGNMTEAREFIHRRMMPAVSTMRAYSYFGNLEISFGHDSGSALSNFTRWLDTRQGSSGVEYTIDGVRYTREYIASFPAGILAARFTASRKGALSLNATFTRSAGIISKQSFSSGKVASITLSGTSGQAASQNPILFTGTARFVNDGGHIVTSNETGSIMISGATKIDVFFDAETNYRFLTQDAIDKEITRKLNKAVSQGYDRVKREAIKDSAGLLNRASIDLRESESSVSSLPTDERILRARTGANDTQLVTLTWNYGRHMLVASSRNTEAAIDMPANLLGIWNNKTSASWGGKYTININTEMNYWPAGQTNLIETQEPLFDLFKLALPRGQALAKAMYNCPGVVFHHNLDIWGDPAPCDNYTSSSMWPMGAAWLVTHLTDHYRFTGDKKLLSSTVFPYLKEVTKFYQCYTFDYQGYKVTGPSLSPENSFKVPDNWTVAGAIEAIDVEIQMDNQIMWQVFNEMLEVASELKVHPNDPDVAAAKAFLPLIHPPRIGSVGQIQEWRNDYKAKAAGHKHLSPLFGLHPGKQFSPLVDADLSQAAGILLDSRRKGGSGSTGWSNAWFINQYARLLRGEDAWAQVKKWYSIYPTRNLWNTDNGAGFQFDGNLGVTSGVTELLLQSHTGIVHILPALPSLSVPAGSARGLKARGNFQVDIEWSGGRLKSATVVSVNGSELKLRVQDGAAFYVNGRLYKETLRTHPGGKYLITLAKA